MPQNIGTVVQIIGAVLDIKFPPEHLPNLLNAIEIEHEGKKLTVEVAQQYSICSVRLLITSPSPKQKKNGKSTVPLRHSRSRRVQHRYLKRVSRS